MNSTNNATARAAFEHARHMFAMAMLDKFNGNYEKARRWANSLKLTQGEVKREVQLTATSQTFTFGVTAQQNSQGATGLFNTEQPLQQQDSLCVSEYGFFVRNPASATSTIDQPRTWGNPSVFTTANVATAINGTLYGGGYFRLTCNNDVLIPQRGLYNHYYVPQTQFRTFTAAATGEQVANQDQNRGAEDGFVTCEPNIVLVGTKNYTPQIQLPANLAAVETNQRAVLIFRGILAQNSTSFT